MTILVSVIAFIVIFSVLILVHEWGHFYFARKAGVKVEEFGIGLPPRAKKLFKDKKGTIYSLNWIPFGGYVKLYGEDSSDPKALKAKNSFASKSILRRTSIIVAGVLMNFALAWVLISIGFMVGMKPFLVTDNDLVRAEAEGFIDVKQVLYIHEIDENGAMAGTEVQAGDLIVEINNEEVPQAANLFEVVEYEAMLQLSILHEGQISSVLVAPNEAGELGMLISDAPYILYLKDQKYPFYRAPLEAIKEVGRLSYLTVDMLGDVIVGLVMKFSVPEGVAGPVGIARLTHHFTQQGIMALIQFMALLSISLGVINIMPFPALDGGRFLFIIFEIITRKKPSAKWEAMIHATGFALLMLLILVITWNDIMSFF